ncbi:MAG: glutaredoxin family protein [Steroidobacteraceae bacterium]
MTGAALTLLTREECGLCGQMQEAAVLWLARHAPSLRLELRDVDADPVLARRYGLRIPVLLLDGERVCEGLFDAAELDRLLRRQLA